MYSIKELAAKAGVSTAAVSLVLNGKWQKKVRPDVAEKIRRLAEENGFVRNVAGRSLAMQRSFRIAVCGESGMIDHPVMGAYSFHEQLGIISARLSEFQYSIDIIRLGDYAKDEDGLQTRLESACDGVIFLQPEQRGFRVRIKRLGLDIPFLVVDSNLNDRSLCYLYTDMAESSSSAIRRLIDRGHRRIAVIRGEVSTKRFRDKLRGYGRALSEGGIEYDDALVQEGSLDDLFTDGYVAAGRLMKMDVRPTAVFCTDNCCGLGVMQFFAEAGVAVPGEMEVIGFGDEAMSTLCRPRMTFLRRPIREMAEKAVRVLLGWIEGNGQDRPMQVEFAEELVVQGTTLGWK